MPLCPARSRAGIDGIATFPATIGGNQLLFMRFSNIQIIGVFSLLVASVIGLGTFRLFVLTDDAESPSLTAQLSISCAAPAGSTSTCVRCYQSFCKTFPAQKVSTLCSSFCNAVVSPPPQPPVASSAPRSSAKSTAPVCGNLICEPTETQYCPRDCPGTASSQRSSAGSSSYPNPLNLSCVPTPMGYDACSSCLRSVCAIRPYDEAVYLCTYTCSLVYPQSSKASSQSSVTSQTSSPREPSGSYIELRTNNPQQFSASGNGWQLYGYSYMHKNAIAPNDAQATATWQATLPFASEYAFYMYWPHDYDTSQQMLMDKVPMSLNLNGASYALTINQRNPTLGFIKTVSGAGPETADHRWYYLGTFKPTINVEYQQPQSMRFFLSTGRASDAVKGSDGWVVGGDLRIYYPLSTVTCGDKKCHDSEKTTCPADCEGTQQCGNGYCDVSLGESAKTCIGDCGASGICGNLKCEGFAYENPGSCPSDCQTGGTTGGTGGDETGGSTGGTTGGGAQCGNGVCEIEEGENTTNCSKDCGGGAACGNGVCDKDRNETAENCPGDCRSSASSKPASSRASSKTSTSSYFKGCGDGICSQEEVSVFQSLEFTPGASTLDLCFADCGNMTTTRCTITDSRGYTCIDSDCVNNQGIQPATVGRTTIGTTTVNDLCASVNILQEGICIVDPFTKELVTSRSWYDIICPYGCLNGACKTAPSPSAAPVQATGTQKAPASSVVTTSPSASATLFVNPYGCSNKGQATGICGVCLNSLCFFSQERAQMACKNFCASVPVSSSSSSVAMVPSSAPSSPKPIPSSAAAASSAQASSAIPSVFYVVNYGANLQDAAPDDTAFSLCLQDAMKAGKTCSIGAGQLTLSIYSPILRSTTGENINANNMVLEGAGDATVIKGISAKGFDVLQLNRVSNMTIRNLSITAEKTTTDQTQGVNGISMTNGTSNIFIDNVTVRNLPHVIKTDYIDGGKAFTVQTGTNPTTSSTNIIIRNSRSFNNPTGFGLDTNPNAGALPGNISFTNSLVENAAFGVSLSFSAKATGGSEIPGFSAEITGNTFTNVRHPLMVGRAPSVRFANNMINVSAEPPLSDPPGFVYRAYPFVILGGLNGTFSQNTINYNMGSGALFLIGGTSIGAYTQNLAFSDNTISAPTLTGVKMQNSGGVAVKNSSFGCNTIKNVLGTFYDPLLANPALANFVDNPCNISESAPQASNSWWKSFLRFTASLLMW
jgi:hypothetical protein